MGSLLGACSEQEKEQQVNDRLLCKKVENIKWVHSTDAPYPYGEKEALQEIAEANISIAATGKHKGKGLLDAMEEPTKKDNKDLLMAQYPSTLAETVVEKADHVLENQHKARTFEWNEIDRSKDKFGTVNKPQRALRYNSGKPDYTYIDYSALEPLARVLEYGDIKYTVGDVDGRNNWRKGFEKPIEPLASMMRHLGELIDAINNRDKDGEFDKESGQHLIGHILCNAMFYSKQFVTDAKRVNKMNPVDAARMFHESKKKKEEHNAKVEQMAKYYYTSTDSTKENI
jgi:hypothetical protein